MNILIIDQTEVICNFLSEELEVDNANFTFTTSLREGESLIENNSYDILIAGASSYEGSTLDLIQNIRDKQGDEMLIIVMSSYPPNSVNEYIESGANYYVNKKLGMIALLKEINSCIDSYQAQLA